MSDILYASDMENAETEIKKILDLAASLKAKVRVLHFDYEIGLKLNQEKLSKLAQKYETKGTVFQYKKLDTIHPLNDHLRKVIDLFKPSLVVLFTDQNRKWYDRLLLSSSSAELSFTAKVPLLVYRKTTK